MDKGANVIAPDSWRQTRQDIKCLDVSIISLLHPQWVSHFKMRRLWCRGTALSMMLPTTMFY